jgi:hypothetical protein
MIIWDFSAIIALGLTVLLSLVITSWVIYTLNRKRKAEEKEALYLNQCPYCTYLFMDYLYSNRRKCPGCGSYLERSLGELQS